MNNKLTLSKVQEQTCSNRRAIDDMRILLEDRAHDIRVDNNVCQLCYYTSRQATNMSVRTNCQLCEVDMLFGNSNTNKLCKDCAIKYRLCKRCGGDMELKDRRKL